MSMKRSAARAAATLAIAGLAGTAAAVAPAQAAAPATATTLAAATAASSTAGGSISRNAVIERAKYWLGKNLTYNQGGSYPDSDGKSYRTDCSGYVSMAWHLTSSLNTTAIGDSSDTYEISRSQLKAGDVLNSYYDHVILFDKWDDAAQTKFSYYSFGSTPVKHITGMSINASTIDGHPNGDYKALRYSKITDGGSGDLTGDGKADLVALESDGSITAADGTGNGFTNYHKIASGFGLHVSADRLNYVDADGDGKADLIGLETNGSLTLAKGTGSGFTDYHTISSGYGEYINNSRLKFGDITGDGKADALAVESDGSLTLAVGTGDGFTNFHKVATGFGEYLTGSRLKLADINGDGKADLIALENNGSLTLATSNGDGFSNYHTISSGYGDYVSNDRLRFGDVTGDGKADILAVETDGSLTLGTGTGDGFKDFHKVATGFGTYVNDHRLQLAG